MYRNYREKSRKIIYIFSFNFEVYGERDMYSPDYEMELLVLIVLNSFYFLTGFNIRLFCLIIVFTIFIMFAGLLIAENPYLAVKVYFDN